MTMAEIESILQNILAAEWRMFQRVKSAAPASCQSNPVAFAKIRGSVFQLWPAEMLDAYLKTLAEAEEKGRNLLTEKYARMDRRIPPINTNPMIEKIVAIEAKWQNELNGSYPALYRRVCRGTEPVDNGSNFSIYLSCELETYGDEVLAKYYEWVTAAAAQDQNLSLTMLAGLVAEGGFDSLEQAELYFTPRL